MNHHVVVDRAAGTERGVTLIEVLVAVLIVSFGLLGLVGLQSRALVYSTGAEESNRAALGANDVATALTLNPTSTGQLNADNANVSSAAAVVAARLPSGAVTVLPAGVGSVKTIVVAWRPTSASSAASAVQYTTQVVVP